MRKQMTYLLAAGGLAAGMITTGLAAGPLLDQVSDRYPGSAQIGAEPVDWHALRQGALRWQTTYATPDGQHLVQQWYAARLQISPASELYAAGADGCAWLQASRLVSHIQRTVSVLLCQQPSGTRVVVNETLELEP